ncbi:MAG: SAM-dependent methyltransferase, partial [Desulfurococcales archaeon]|nr:SAM-dependent methyltransferase [Desulfurococcales archaeon]
MPLILAGGGLGPGYQGRLLEDAVASADKVYVETYTVPGSNWLLDWARSIAGDRVIEADRSSLEENASKLVEEAKTLRVLVLAPGDPLIATTHRSLLALARKEGIVVRVIPGVSGVCASKTLSLLDYYKYGRTVTVPGPWRGVKPYSVVYYILVNACSRLHTLVLLDFQGNKALAPSEAASTLVDIAREVDAGFLADAPVIVVERAGLEGERATLHSSLE